MFISFACPKETNQRKRQPQIFFGLNILSVAHALQLALPPLRDRSNSDAFLGHSLRNLKNANLFPKKDLVASLDLRRFGLEFSRIRDSGSTIWFQKVADNFGAPVFHLAHAIQLVVLRPPQTVLLTAGPRSKPQNSRFIPKFSESG